jgi:hypothetical protein
VLPGTWRLGVRQGGGFIGDVAGARSSKARNGEISLMFMRSLSAVEGRTRASTSRVGIFTETNGDGRGSDSWNPWAYLIGMRGTAGVRFPMAGLWPGVLERAEELPPNFLRPVKEVALFSDWTDAFSFSFLGHEISCC